LKVSNSCDIGRSGQLAESCHKVDKDRGDGHSAHLEFANLEEGLSLKSVDVITIDENVIVNQVLGKLIDKSESKLRDYNLLYKKDCQKIRVRFCKDILT